MTDQNPRDDEEVKEIHLPANSNGYMVCRKERPMMYEPVEIGAIYEWTVPTVYDDGCDLTPVAFSADGMVHININKGYSICGTERMPISDFVAAVDIGWLRRVA